MVLPATASRWRRRKTHASSRLSLITFICLINHVVLLAHCVYQFSSIATYQLHFSIFPAYLRMNVYIYVYLYTFIRLLAQAYRSFKILWSHPLQSLHSIVTL